MRSTKNKQVSTRARVSDLIKATAGRGAHNRAALTNEPAARADLELIIAHNDSAGAAKVTADEAIKLLRESYGWTGNSKDALNAFCRRALGRTSFGKK